MFSKARSSQELAAIATIALFVAMMPKADAAIMILDQSFTPPADASHYAVFDDRTAPMYGTWFQDLAQTFTVSTGGALCAVEVGIHGATFTGPLQFDIRNTFGGVPQEANTPVLVSRTIPYANVVAAIGDGPPGGYFRIDFSDSAIPVAPGQVLAIVLRSSSNQGYGWLGSNYPDGYVGGRAFSRNDTLATWNDFSGDLGFRTYVVPESSSLTLLGPLGFGWRRRRPAGSSTKAATKPPSRACLS